MDITRGSLDGITRSGRSHQRQRTDSRISLQSGSGSPALRLKSESRGSLEILPPELNFHFQDRDLELEEYLSSSDEEETYANREGDAIHQLEQLILSSSRSSQYAVTISSDIVEEDGLDGRPCGKKNEDVGSPSPQQGNLENEDDDDLKHIEDPKLRKAMKKMRKLDKILSQKVAREKEVKQQRLMMHRQYEAELERIRLGLDRSEPKDEMENTLRFLALVPPPAHSEGIDANEDDAASPLFQTQPLSAVSSERGLKKSKHAPSVSEMSTSSRQSKDADLETEVETDRSKGVGRRRKSKAEARKRTTKDEDDFIQRNIQLACDAGNMIAMTDDEKKRLGELLQDVEMLVDKTQDNEEVIGTEVQTLPGIGFQPDRSEEEALKDLDNKLKVLMPAECFEEIRSTPSVRNHSNNSHIEYCQEAFELGEKLLGLDNRETRDHQDRLKQIEEELSLLQTQVEREISSPSLSKDELDDLFRQCDDVDTRTQSALESSPRIPRPPFHGNLWNNDDHSSMLSHRNDQSGSDTSRSAKLPDETLKKLLEEAKLGLGLEEPSTDGDMSEGISFGGEDEGRQSDDGDDDARQEGSRLLQKSSSVSRVPLVSHDIIQMLLRNPRVTLDEAKKPSYLESDVPM